MRKVIAAVATFLLLMISLQGIAASAQKTNDLNTVENSSAFNRSVYQIDSERTLLAQKSTSDKGPPQTTMDNTTFIFVIGIVLVGAAGSFYRYFRDDDE